MTRSFTPMQLHRGGGGAIARFLAQQFKINMRTIVPLILLLVLLRCLVEAGESISRENDLEITLLSVLLKGPRKKE